MQIDAVGALMPGETEREPRKPLDPKRVEHAKPREKDYKLADTGGLYLFVSKSGHRTWRLKYRFGGKERRLLLGAYPDVGLKRARELRDDAKQALRNGLDPGLERTRARHSRKVGHENTFEKFAREWHEKQVPRWKPVHANDVITSMEQGLFPEIGGIPVDQIDEGLLFHALRKVESRGAIETAHRLRQHAERVFRFAAAEGIKNGNPAVNVRDALKPVPPRKRRPALVDVKQIQRLIRDIDHAAASPVTRLSSRFLALTAQQPGMVRNAVWPEIKGVDWAKPDAPSPDAKWHIPAAKMKQELDLRENEAFDHEVPLSVAAVEVLRVVRAFSSPKGPIFPSGRDILSPLSENAVGYLYNREGWKDRDVPPPAAQACFTDGIAQCWLLMTTVSEWPRSTASTMSRKRSPGWGIKASRATTGPPALKRIVAVWSPLPRSISGSLSAAYRACPLDPPAATVNGCDPIATLSRRRSARSVWTPADTSIMRCAAPKLSRRGRSLPASQPAACPTIGLGRVRAKPYRTSTSRCALPIP